MENEDFSHFFQSLYRTSSPGSSDTSRSTHHVSPSRRHSTSSSTKPVMGPLKLSVAQYPTGPTLASTLTSLRAITKDAAASGVHLLLFPEAFLGGYPRTCSFGAVVGSRTEKGREQYYEYWKQAVDLGDSCPDGTGVYRLGAGDGTREVLESVAAETGVFLIVGVVEKSGGSMYCGCVFVDPVKGIVGKRRKVMPTGTERVVWGVGSPKTLKAIEATIAGEKVILGAAICWENYMPLLRASLYAQGVSIYLAPTADDRESWTSTLRHIAMEGRCYVLGCNQIVTNKTLPKFLAYPIAAGDDGDSDSGLEEYLSKGGSAIVDPLGKIIAGPLLGREGRLDVVIEQFERTLIGAKLDMDVGAAGHYGRGDVFRLKVEGLDLGTG